MAIEEQIVAWSQERPAWQRAVMRRTAVADLLSDDDYDQLVNDIVNPVARVDGRFGLEDLPRAEAEDSPVQLVSIAEPEHLNALASKQPLTFAPNGLTIVYGDNGSGKSGYARLLKRIARSRHQEEILSDVFRDTVLARPTARLSVRIGNQDETLSWPASAYPDLRRMLFYDGLCGQAYISTESGFPYRPSVLAVMDGLISACVAVRSRIDAKLDENAKAAKPLPSVPDELKESASGTFLESLSGRSSVEALDALITRFDTSRKTIGVLRNEEARLRSEDKSNERQHLLRQAEKLDLLLEHIDKLRSVFGSDALHTLRERHERLKTLEQATILLARSFRSEPLSGVGSSPWKALWESAKHFSEEHAYPEQPYPVVNTGSRCVLCQQELDPEGRDRLSRFARFVGDDTQVRLAAAREEFDAQVRSVTTLLASPEIVVSTLSDLEASHPELVADTRAVLAEFERFREKTLGALERHNLPSSSEVEPASTVERLARAASAAREMAQTLDHPELVQTRLAATTSRRQELALLKQIKESRDVIKGEIGRRQEREALEAAKTAAATGPITKKMMDLSEESITEVVRDAFTRETDRLRLERVTIARTRADKGSLLHQPKLVGARQEAKLPRVFSEGERTALGLAAFFTEAQLDGSKSALILDDPVNSLDHIRRGLVAARLAALAEEHQVVIFTHDVSFVADLKREAIGRGVDVTERGVTRSRAAEGKPGACTTKHPWKAKDAAARIDELRRELARIKREARVWDEKTFEDAVAVWAGNLSETWERIFSQEIVGPVLVEGGLEVRPLMVKVLARFSEEDHRSFEASYNRVSQWAKRHDKSTIVNYTAPDSGQLEEELDLVDGWFKRVKGYKA